MPTTIEGIEADISEASGAGFRGKLLARGQARAIIWQEGVLPPNSPNFDERLSYDLQSYGYTLLGLGLRLTEMGGDPAQARMAFEQAATALEAVFAKGDPEQSERSFHLVMAAASFHLANLSARAFSLLSIIVDSNDFSPIERALAQLMRREFADLRDGVLGFRVSGEASDDNLTAAIQQKLDEFEAGDEVAEEEREFHFDYLNVALVDNFFSGLSLYLLGVERGDQKLFEQALKVLETGLDICADLNLVPQWWSHRVACHLLTDLWSDTFHQRLPREPAGGEAADWHSLRELFVASLYRRRKSEVDLWPSQIEAARRSVDQSDNLVVSLPTSAGKTRIAELCILRCLASARRIVFVTPLRALSAQTEVSLRSTFGPLGKTVSALYGTIGVSSFDEDVIRESDIVVATPEKLDFALRNDPTLLDDVGLIVFDEGHMIGVEEREVRYEVQIQRLLRRPDADQRRIVCLSAILPDNDQLEDFANWLCRDQPQGVVKSEWRPTRLRFGEVVWNSPNARLNLQVGEEQPWVQQFIIGRAPPTWVKPKRKRTKIFPCDQPELSLATAWRFVDEGQTVLIYCPLKSSVEPFADRIIDLHERGALRSLLDVDEAALSNAISLGEEWLGAGSPVLECLRLGVALHHGSLPTAYRKEIEKLLRDGVLKVTISSPTLAQGLNLSATVIVMHSLHRNREIIKASEFKNVIGRAGRAYIDVEGIVVHPMFDKTAKRRKNWEAITEDLSAREMESGLALLVFELLTRMKARIGGDVDQLVEYVVNGASEWTFPEVPDEKPEDRERALNNWTQKVNSLDNAILSLLGEDAVADEDIVSALDLALQSSLWHRRLARLDEDFRHALLSGLHSRGRFIWANSTAIGRKGYFLAGVGLATGHALDAISEEANRLLVQANSALIEGDVETSIAAITTIAEMVFQISPFVPKTLPENWKPILRGWMMGVAISEVAAGEESEALQFIEDGLVYCLPWAMEAIRVRATANGDKIGDDVFLVEDYELGHAVSAVETGTTNRSASILIQAGFNSRIASIKAVTDTQATFQSNAELRQWLRSPAVTVFEEQPDWPSASTRSLWEQFKQSFVPREKLVWGSRYYKAKVDWSHRVPDPGTPLQFHNVNGQQTLLGPDAEIYGVTDAAINSDRHGLLLVEASEEKGFVDLKYLGPDDLT